MRRFFSWMMIAALVFAGTSVQAANDLPEPKLMAVYFYADWCPNCKALSATVAQARADGGLDTKDVLFVTIDFTDKAKTHQSILHAQALGIGDYLKAQGSATGYIALLDVRSIKEITRFDRSSDSAGMLAAITQNLKP